MQDFYSSPVFFVIAGIAFLALVALTMRSVIRRDRAMIDMTMDEPRQAAYKQRWRDAA